MDSPRTTSLYREIAKDFNPKKAEMNICKYVEALEARLLKLEANFAALSAPDESKNAKQQKSTAKAPAAKDGE